MNSIDKLNVVIVDDEWLIRAELKSLLKSLNCVNVIGDASNVPEAIDILKQEQPDLVFLDINLPGRSGFNLLDSTKQKFDVIFISGYDDMIQKAHNYNAIDYLTKPINRVRLSEAVNKALDKRSVKQ